MFSRHGHTVNRWSWRRSAGALLAAALLVVQGCSHAPRSEEPAPKVHPRYSHTLTLTVPAGTTAEEMARRCGGDVLARSSGEDGSKSAFVVLGFTGSSAELQALSAPAGAGTCGAGEGQTLGIEANAAAFLAGAERLAVQGGSGLWVEGRSRIWDDGPVELSFEGTSGLWSRGPGSLETDGRDVLWNGEAGRPEFTLFPMNTAHWEVLGLYEAQDASLANRLGEGVTVAVIDTGVDLDHPFFDGRQVFTAPETWRDFVAADNFPQEEGNYGDPAYGHGTNVAGIILQVAPRAKIMPIRVLDPDGQGFASDLVQAVEHAVSRGADIINLSLGAAGPSEAVSSVISWAAHEGVYVVMSAGNTGELADPERRGQVTFPATLSRNPAVDGDGYLLTVTSTRIEGSKSDFAAAGEAVGIAAPGEEVDGPAPGSLSARWTGTSMAAPMASGALALALAEGSNRMDKVGGELITELLESGADHHDAGQQGIGESRLLVSSFLHAVLTRESD